jgi:uncharacterized protein YdhG (YjbR/CyaY superfamily)
MRQAAAGTATIDAYLASTPPDQRVALQRLRKAVLAAAPGAEECFYYRMPAFRHEGKALVAFAAAKRHCALYPLSGRVVTAHRAALSGFETSKGTIRFQPDRPLPLALIRKLVRARIAENRGKR